MKKLLGIIGLVAIVLIIALINRSPDTAQTNEPIRIGGLLSLTGVAADFGQMSKKAMELAVEEINADGGIDGRMIELSIEDDQTNPQTAVSAYNKLTSINNVDAVVGGLFDFTAQPIFPLAERDKVVFISPINFVIDGAFEMNEYSFVMYPRFENVIRELERVIVAKDIQKLGMIRFQSDFSGSIENTLAGIMEKNNRAPLITETYAEIGNSDFRTPILKVQQENSDAIFLDMLDFDIVKYLSQSEDLNFTKQIIGYTTLRDVVNNPDVDTAKLEGAIMLDWEIPSEEFEKRFEARYGELPRRGANKSYDAVYVLAEAIAKSETQEDVPHYIAKETFTTANGTFSFTEDHAVEKTPVKVFEIIKGALIEIR